MLNQDVSVTAAMIVTVPPARIDFLFSKVQAMIPSERTSKVYLFLKPFFLHGKSTISHITTTPCHS